MGTNKSPLRYPGGKTRACKIIEQIISNHTDISSYDLLISPFFGGGSFEFYLQNRYNIPIIANDNFKPLYIFWEQAKNNNKELCNKIRSIHPLSSGKFKLYRDIIKDMIISIKLDSIHTDKRLEIAAYYFAINRCSFSGATLSGGYSQQASEKRFTESSIERVGKLNLENVEFYDDDFVIFFEEEVISPTKDSKNKLIFLDPPYYLNKKSKLYGVDGDKHLYFNHERLRTFLNLIDQLKYDWVLCYNDCEYIRKLYNKYKIIKMDWKYGMNKSKKSSEILILNIGSN